MILQILPVFLIIVFGYLLSVIKVAHDSWVPILNKFGLYIGFPVLILSNLIRVDREVLTTQIPVFIATMAIILGFMVLSYYAIKLFRIPKEIGLVLMTGGYFGNIGYLGFPLITAIFPEAGATVSIIVATYSISLFTAGMFLLESLSGEEKHVSDILKGMVTSPFIIAITAGLLIVILDIRLPKVILDTITMIEGSASPVVLIGLGIFMHRKIAFHTLWKPITVISGIKMILFPAIFFLASRLFGLGKPFDAAILEASMPTAITVFALSDRFPMNKELAVSIIILTTLVTPILYPLIVSFL